MNALAGEIELNKKLLLPASGSCSGVVLCVVRSPLDSTMLTIRTESLLVTVHGSRISSEIKNTTHSVLLLSSQA